MPQEVEMEPIPHCRRCGYANARTWLRCGGCDRVLPRPEHSSRPGAQRARQRRVLGDIATAGWIVPGANAALVGTALWGHLDAAQRSQLLLAASVAASVAVAGAGLAAHQLAAEPGARVRDIPAPLATAPVPGPCERRRPDRLTDAELRAAIAW
jgi:hypothetical protein